MYGFLLASPTVSVRYCDIVISHSITYRTVGQGNLTCMYFGWLRSGHMGNCSSTLCLWTTSGLCAVRLSRRSFVDFP